MMNAVERMRPPRASDVRGSATAGSEFRRVLGHLPTSVSVVTGADESGAPAGLVVGSFVSISLAPQLVGFFVAETSTTWPRLRPRGTFAVNVLDARQVDITAAFSRPASQKFDEVSWVPSEFNRNPLLAGAHLWVDCVTEEEVALGDHFLVVGRVCDLASDGKSGSPLVFHRRAYVPLDISA